MNQQTFSVTQNSLQSHSGDEASGGRVGRQCVLVYAKTGQAGAHLIEALLLAIVNGPVKVPAMEYADCDNCLASAVTSTWSNVPGAVKGPNLETAAAFLFRQDKLSNSP